MDFHLHYVYPLAVSGFIEIVTRQVVKALGKSSLTQRVTGDVKSLLLSLVCNSSLCLFVLTNSSTVSSL